MRVNSEHNFNLHALRHTTVLAEGKDRLLGQWDLPLSEEGLSEARSLVHQAALRIPKDSVSAIYTSDLSRCSAIAELLHEETGWEVRRDPRLREQELGDWEGKTGEELKQGPREDLEAFHFSSGSWHPPGGGESLVDVAKRSFEWFAEASRARGNRDVVLIAHSGVLRVLIAKIIGLPFDNAIAVAPPIGSYSRMSCDHRGNGLLECLGA